MIFARKGLLRGTVGTWVALVTVAALNRPELMVEINAVAMAD